MHILKALNQAVFSLADSRSISTGSAETGAFSWFNDLMASLEWEKEKLGKVGFLNYHLFLTGWNSSIVSLNSILIPTEM